jgi:hypothetical protein
VAFAEASEMTVASNVVNDVLSPELVLVSSPEARARAIAELPAVASRSAASRPATRGRWRVIGAGVLSLLQVAAIALATTFSVVLVLTVVADALR